VDLTGKRALVTGAAKRVGRAIALELAGAGCDVAVHYWSSEDEAVGLREQITAVGRRCCLVRGDLGDPDTPGRLVDETVAALGGLDILVNNASVFGRMALEDFDPGEWERDLRVNLTAVAGMCHHARAHLLEGAGGKIVNLCDIAAERPWKGHLAYCVSKAGIVCLTKALARELAPKVQVNGVAPGIAVFPEYYDEATRQALIGRVPLKRAGSPVDVAATVRFLVERGDYITGQIIPVDGGRSIV